MDLEQPIWAVMSADGRHAALTGLTGQVEILDLESGQPVRPALQAHESASYWAAFSPDGSQLVSNAQDGSVLLWDVDTAQVTASARISSRNPTTAAASASEFLPDVILCDIGLPGFDGFEVARRVRALPGLEGALLVAVSGYASEEDRRRSHEAGFQHHLAKPADPLALRKVLASRTA